MSYYLENLYKADPDHPVRQALSTRHNFRVIIEKLNATMAVVNNLVIRNNIVYTYVESVDATHPFEIDFHIPTATDAIKKISLTLKGIPFRAYAQAAASGGGHTTAAGGGHTTASGGGSTSGGGGGQTSSVASGSAQIGFSTFITANVTNVGDEGESGKLITNINTSPVASYVHTHTVSNHNHSTPNHAHAVADHQHEVADHVHDLTFGIYESTTPTAVNGYYDDGGGYSAADSYGNAPDTTTPWNIKTEYDITSKYSGTGWKRLKLDTSRLGRFNVILMIEVDLTPTS